MGTTAPSTVGVQRDRAVLVTTRPRATTGVMIFVMLFGKTLKAQAVTKEHSAVRSRPQLDYTFGLTHQFDR